MQDKVKYTEKMKDLLLTLLILSIIMIISHEEGANKMENQKAFQTLLRQAIGNRTQAQFANDSGVSAEHLSRMINGTVSTNPTRTTLAKIAAVAKNGVTYEKLMNAVNGKQPPITKSDIERNANARKAAREFEDLFEEDANEVMQTLAAIIEETEFPFVAMSVEIMIDNLVTEYEEHKRPGLLPVSYMVEEERPYIGMIYPEAEYYRNVVLSMARYEMSAVSQMIVYYRKIADKPVIQKISMAVKNIEDLYGTPAAALSDGGQEEALDVAYELPYYLQIEKNKRFYEHYVDPEAETAEEKVLSSIFGKKVIYPTSIEGFGFWLPEVPPNFYQFVKKHQGQILNLYDDEPEMWEIMKHRLETAKEADLLSCFRGIEEDGVEYEYMDENSYEYGWQAAISNVMSEETGWRFEFQPHKESSQYTDRSDKDCILIRKENIEQEGIRRETLLYTVCDYARELGIEYFGDILFHTMVEVERKPHEYKVIKEPEKEKEREPNFQLYEPEKGKKPEETGLYFIRLKDGRVRKCIFLKGKDYWIARHKEWSRLIESFDPEPLQERTPM